MNIFVVILLTAEYHCYKSENDWKFPQCAVTSRLLLLCSVMYVGDISCDQAN